MLLRRAILFLRLAMACAALSAIALLLLPFSGAFDENAENILTLILPTVFWGGWVMELIFFEISNVIGKKLRRQFSHGKRLYKAPPGIATFGSNKEACVFDIILCAEIVITVVLLICQVRNEWLLTSSVALLFLSLNLHCIFNGRHYRKMKQFQKTQNTDREK